MDPLSTSPSRGNWSRREHRRLGLFSVTMIIFFNVSGGPLGSEEAIRYGGPLVGLLSFLVFTVLYSMPQAMVTAELSTAFPDNGGYSLWVKAAFGDFWGVQQSYWSWFAGVVDNALYPVLLYSSAAQFFASLHAPAGGPLPSNLPGCHPEPHRANATLHHMLFTAAEHGHGAPPAPPALPPAAADPASGNLWLGLLSGQGGSAMELGMRLLILG